MTKPIIAFANNSRFFSRYRKAALEKLGFEVKFCENAGEVLELFEPTVGQKPVILVTDMMLVHGDELGEERTRGMEDTGLALYEILRARNHNDLHVVIYTTSRYACERVRERKYPNLVVIYDCDPNSDEQILRAVRIAQNSHLQALTVKIP